MEILDGSVSTTRMIVDLEPGEPVFVLRGNDATALVALAAWEQANKYTLPEDKLTRLAVDVARFIDWRTGHRPLLKMPD